MLLLLYVTLRDQPLCRGSLGRIVGVSRSHTLNSSCLQDGHRVEHMVTVGTSWITQRGLPGGVPKGLRKSVTCTSLIPPSVGRAVAQLRVIVGCGRIRIMAMILTEEVDIPIQC